MSEQAKQGLSDRRDLLGFLKEISPFNLLKPITLELLAEKFELRRVAASTIIIRQGDSGDACYWIRSGSVEIVVGLGTRDERQLTTLRAGAMFGETALLTQSPRNATVRALESTELLSLGQQDFFLLIEHDPHISREIWELLTLRDRPQRKTDIILHRKKMEDGSEDFILEDKRSHIFLRLSREGALVWEHLDGKKTLKDLTLLVFEKQHVFAPHMIAGVIALLRKADFLESPLQKASWIARLVGDEERPSLLGRLFRIMNWTYARRDADRWMHALYTHGGHYFFSRTAIVIEAIIILFGAVLYILNFSFDFLRLPEMSEWIHVALMLIVSIFFHELGHALMVKAYGRSVGGIGCGWHWCVPFFFVDTSSMWLEGRRARAAVAFAGPAVNLLFGALSSGAAVLFSSSSVDFFFWSFATLSYVIVLINLVPLFQMDGEMILHELMGTSGSAVKKVNPETEEMDQNQSS